MDGLSENGDGIAGTLSGFDVTRKAVFFGHFLLGQQKKVPRASARNALDPAAFGEIQHRPLGEELSPDGESLSLLAPAVLALRAGFAVRACGAVLVQRK